MTLLGGRCGQDRLPVAVLSGETAPLFSYTVRMGRAAECHPDRPHVAKGLCASCYVVARRKRVLAEMTDEDREALRLKERAYFTAYRRAWREENPERSRAAQRKANAESYQRDPVKHRQRAAADRYGLTVPQYVALIARAEGHCEACGVASGRLQVDHCHQSGAIRGVICRACNSALGHAGDDLDRLRALISYLQRVGTMS